MSISVVTSKGQITIPKKIRDALGIKPSEKVIITIEKDCVVLRPVAGNILEIGGSINIPAKERPIDFKKVRRKVRRQIGRSAARDMEE